MGTLANAPFCETELIHQGGSSTINYPEPGRLAWPGLNTKDPLTDLGLRQLIIHIYN
jgi:hypothetical protein